MGQEKMTVKMSKVNKVDKDSIQKKILMLIQVEKMFLKNCLKSKNNNNNILIIFY